MFYHHGMTDENSKPAKDNRTVIPAAIRLPPLAESVRESQELVRQYIPAERNLVDELLAERRQDASQE